MRVQEQMTMASSFAELWKALLPQYKVPAAQQFLLWAGTYPEELVSRGISRAAAKSQRMQESGKSMAAEEAIRYAASVMKNELLGIRRHGTNAGGAQ
jgi:hypothetical protein